MAVQNEHSSQQFELTGDQQTVEVHTVLVQRLISQGGGPNALLSFFVDAVYSSASEDPIEERIRFSSECRG